MSLGIDKRLQSLRLKLVKDCRLDKEGNNKPIGTGLVGRNDIKIKAIMGFLTGNSKMGPSTQELLA